MRRLLSTTLAMSLLGLGTAGCSDFLSDEDVAQNPNNPTAATRDALFVGVQAGQFGVQEAGLAQIAGQFTQQITGVQRFSQQRTQYGFIDTDYNADWAQIYGGGGLKEIREVRASATADGDRVYAGIAKVWEAFIMGTTASIWGDIPYREAGPDNPTPALDPQLQVYDDLQALLTEALADLASGEGLGPGTNDLVFAGDVTKWTETANTLRARFYLHTAEVRGTPAYEGALAAATAGISTPDNDFTAYHSQANLEQNFWWQFHDLSGFGVDIVAGRFLADLMVARNDPRLAEYFGPSDPGPYGGASPQGDESPTGVSFLEGTRNDPNFRQPLITWAENQMILAEANFVLNGASAAQPFVDALRASVGLPSTPVTSLNTIMEEKYIALFQNIEVWNDYKRTCYPPIVPFSTVQFNNQVPGRVFYAQGEQNANSAHVPDVATQLQIGGSAVSGGITGFRNPNDPNPCP